jgi:hypothetical protein
MWPGMTVDDCHHLPHLVDVAAAEGFRPLRIQTATRGEWEEFESGYAAEAEEWLLANGDHSRPTRYGPSSTVIGRFCSSCLSGQAFA